MRQNTATNVGMLHESRYTSIAMLRFAAERENPSRFHGGNGPAMAAGKSGHVCPFSDRGPISRARQRPGSVALERATGPPNARKKFQKDFGRPGGSIAAQFLFSFLFLSGWVFPGHRPALLTLVPSKNATLN
jgi:hypothetical protein